MATTSSRLDLSVSLKLKLAAVDWPSFLTTYIISIIATYLTGVWEITITNAAAIVILYSGIVAILPVAIKLIVDAIIGDYWMVFISRLAFVVGSGLLIGSSQEILFYISLALLAVGVSAQFASTLKLNGDKSSSSEPLLPTSSHGAAGVHWTWALFKNLLLGILVFFLPGVSIIAIGYVSAWWIKFTIATVVAVVSTIVFFTTSSSSYQRAQRGLTIITNISRKTHFKTILFIISMSITFILLGIVSSIGNTFFILQAVDMNHYVGSLWVPILILPLLQGLARNNYHGGMSKTIIGPLFGIAVSMVYATLCCITAAKVETRRLGVVKTAGFSDDSTSIISMTMFWLVPQYILLGMTEGLSQASIVGFFSSELLGGAADEGDEAEKASKEKYMETFAQGVRGVGIIAGLVAVYVVGDIQPTWFQDSVNKSRLDNYYWVLSALLAITLVVFSFFSCCSCIHKRSEDSQGTATTA